MMVASKRDIRTYKKGQIIFREGEEANCMYDIYGGSVGIYTNYGTKKEKMLAQLGPEKFFGEMGLVDAMPRSATAVALEKDTKIEVITGDTFGGYLEERPAKVLMIMQHMSRRMRELTRDYLDVCRTVAENVDAAKEGKQRSEEQQKQLKKYSDIYWASVQN